MFFSFAFTFASSSSQMASTLSRVFFVWRLFRESFLVVLNVPFLFRCRWLTTCTISLLNQTETLIRESACFSPFPHFLSQTSPTRLLAPTHSNWNQLVSTDFGGCWHCCLLVSLLVTTITGVRERWGWLWLVNCARKLSLIRIYRMEWKILWIFSTKFTSYGKRTRAFSAVLK